MPGKLQGTTLSRRLRELAPELPVVFMSGYASESTIHGNGLRPEDIRLMKPVQRRDLLAAVFKAVTTGLKQPPSS
jgi:FixJ family two-component response regulator